MKKYFKGIVSMSLLIELVIIALVFGSLIGTVADSTIGINNSALSSNVTGATGSLIDLVPLFLGIVVLLGFIRHLRE